jgi:hypothetical protein
MNTAKPKRKHRRTGKPGHMPPFVPTKTQRVMVSELAGLRMSWDELTTLIVNPRTNKPITKTTLARVFATELAQARGRLKQLIGRSFYAALQAGEPWATRLAMKNVLGWSSGTLVPMLDGDEQRPRTIAITFHTPDPKPLRPLIDVTAREPSQPPKPYVEGRALPAPPERRQHPLGWLE